MARQIVNVGASPNDNTGDKVRDAFIKVNANFAEQYTAWVTSNSYTVGNTTVNTFINASSITVTSIVANTTIGTNGQILTSDGTKIYWGPAIAGVNVNATYAWTNTHSFSGNVVFSNTVTANGTIGTNGQVLTSNGSGVYWATQTLSPPTSQMFTSTGGALYVLATTVTDQRSCIVTVDGLVQIPGTHYTISGTTLSFITVPVTGSVIEVRNWEIQGQTSSSQSFTGAGFSTFILMTPPSDPSLLIVTIDGLVQIPNIHYTISGVALNFANIPTIGSVIEVRTLARI